IEVIDGNYAALKQMQVTMIAQQATGFSFYASWPTPPVSSPFSYARMTVRTTLELSCAPETITKVIHAAMVIHFYVSDQEFKTPQWVIACDTCTGCSINAEMAPSPIVPEKSADDLPLARALRLRLVELARVSNAVVLLAENDGGSDVEYEWHPS